MGGVSTPKERGPKDLFVLEGGDPRTHWAGPKWLDGATPRSPGVFGQFWLFEPPEVGPQRVIHGRPTYTSEVDCRQEGSETVMSEFDIFVSPAGIITLDHMEKLKNNTLVGNTGLFYNEVDLVGSEGFEGTDVDHVKPQKIVIVSLGAELTVLTREQAVSQGVKVESPFRPTRT